MPTARPHRSLVMQEPCARTTAYPRRNTHHERTCGRGECPTDGQPCGTSRPAMLAGDGAQDRGARCVRCRTSWGELCGSAPAGGRSAPPAEPPLDFGRIEAFDRRSLAARCMPRDDLHGTAFEAESPSEQSLDGCIRPTVGRRGRHAHLERPVEPTGNLVARGTRNDLERQVCCGQARDQCDR